MLKKQYEEDQQVILSLSHCTLWVECDRLYSSYLVHQNLTLTLHHCISFLLAPATTTQELAVEAIDPMVEGGVSVLCMRLT